MFLVLLLRGLGGLRGASRRKTSRGDMWGIAVLPSLPCWSLGFSLSTGGAGLLVALNPPNPTWSSYEAAMSTGH